MFEALTWMTVTEWMILFCHRFYFGETWRQYGFISFVWSSSETPRLASRVWSEGSPRAASPRCQTQLWEWTSSPVWWRSSRAKESNYRSGTLQDRRGSGKDTTRSLILLFICPQNGTMTYKQISHRFLLLIYVKCVFSLSLWHCCTGWHIPHGHGHCSHFWVKNCCCK